MVYRRLRPVLTHTPTRRISQAKLLARSRLLVQAAKRKARRPMTPLFLGWKLSASDFVPAAVLDRRWSVRTLKNPPPWSRRVQLSIDALPEKLIKPEMPPLDLSRIEAVEPTLKGTSPLILRKAYFSMKVQMLGMFESSYMDPPNCNLPKTVNVKMPGAVLSSYPTHTFAIYPPASKYTSSADRVTRAPWHRRRVSMYAVHWIPFATACSNLPLLPPTTIDVKPTASKDAHGNDGLFMFNVPLVPMRVPDIDTFPFILHYVYFASEWNIHRQMMPPNANAHGIRDGTATVIPREEFIERLVSNVDLVTLWKHAHLVYGFYENLVALGISDEGVWSMLEYTWGALVAAIEELNSEQSD